MNQSIFANLPPLGSKVDRLPTIPFEPGSFALVNERPDNLHPLEQELAAYALGKLPDYRATMIEQHLLRCPPCAAIAAEAPDDDFVNRLRAAKRVDGELPILLLEHPRYRLVRPIGKGGMATVYLAEHRLLRNRIALKTIRPEYAQDRLVVMRFLQEAQTAAQLGHTNIARIYDAEEIDSTLLMAMEYVEGKTAAQVVARKGPLPVPYACHYVRQIAIGLQHAHARGVIHRDIKPQNLMIVPSTGHVKILDFGLGRLVDAHRSRDGLTKDDEILGTPHYMAPEQASNAREADIRSDIYSLGCTFFFFLTGETLFRGESLLDLLMQHETAPPRNVRGLRPGVPPEIDSLLQRMLAKDPQDRPQTPQEVANIVADYCPAARASKTETTERTPNHSLNHWRMPLCSPAILLPVLTFFICLAVLFWR